MSSKIQSWTLGFILICARIQKACSKAGRFGISDVNPSTSSTNFEEIKKGQEEFLKEFEKTADYLGFLPIVSESLIISKKSKVTDIFAGRGNHSGSEINNYLFLLSEECSEVITALVMRNKDEFWLEAHDVLASFDLLVEAFESASISTATTSGKD